MREARPFLRARRRGRHAEARYYSAPKCPIANPPARASDVCAAWARRRGAAARARGRSDGHVLWWSSLLSSSELGSSACIEHSNNPVRRKRCCAVKTAECRPTDNVALQWYGGMRTRASCAPSASACCVLHHSTEQHSTAQHMPLSASVGTHGTHHRPIAARLDRLTAQTQQRDAVPHTVAQPGVGATCNTEHAAHRSAAARRWRISPLQCSACAHATIGHSSI